MPSIPCALTKAHIVGRLAALKGYRRYLELCTPTTGLFYADVHRSRFDVCHRLMYRCPNDFTDGMEIEYRSAGLDIAECLEQIRNGNLRYDIILVDPWHDYDTSLRDLSEAFELIPIGGTLVVHDCLPPTEESTNPDGIVDPIAGGWAGLTHRAYLDFVLGRSDLRYFTVDADWGCGVIRKIGDTTDPEGHDRPSSEACVQADGEPRDLAIARWRTIGDEHRHAYRFLRQHSRALLNLITADEFLRADEGDGSSRSLAPREV
jgi:hypothetical protein